MSRITLTSFALLLLLFLGNSSANYAAQSKQNTSDAPTGTLQKMIVENGSVTMNLDLNRLNGINPPIARPVTAKFRRRNQFVLSRFWFLTICCAVPSRDRWPRSASQHSDYFPQRWARPSTSSWSKSFLPAQDSISPCATATPDSRSLILKDTSTITIPKRSR